MMGHGLHGSPVPHKLQLFINLKAQSLQVGAAQKALHIKCVRSCMSKIFIVLCFIIAAPAQHAEQSLVACFVQANETQ
jgi:hypothetical protein